MTTVTRRDIKSLAVSYEAFCQSLNEGNPSPVWARILDEAQQATGVLLVSDPKFYYEPRDHTVTFVIER
jgi:hypothetical protein